MSDHPAVPPLEPRFLEPAGFRWGAFTNARGFALRWGHLPAPNATKTCVLVGGFIEFIEKYFETIRDLSALGLSVWCLDWYGQGGSERPKDDPTRPFARDFDADAADLAQFAKTIVPGDKPRLLVAHSMGGAISLLCVKQNPSLFDAAAMSAPMFGLAVGAMPSWLTTLVVDLAVAFGQGRRFVPGGQPWHADTNLSAKRSHTSNDDVRCLVLREWFSAQPNLRVDAATYGWVHAALPFMRRIMQPEFLRAVSVPILIGSAGHEMFVDPRQHRKAAEFLPHCTLVEFPTAKHELFMDTNNVRVPWFAAIDDFAKVHLPARDHLAASQAALPAIDAAQ